jgi:hypothetical protein
MPSRRKAKPKARAPPKPVRKLAPKAKPAARPSPRSPSKTLPKKAAAKPPVKKGPVNPPKGAAPARPKSAGGKPSSPAPVPETVPVRATDRAHLLSLSFLRDGDEFLARLETDSGQITELKNRFLDQLLSLVANELEDLLE